MENSSLRRSSFREAGHGLGDNGIIVSGAGGRYPSDACLAACLGVILLLFPQIAKAVDKAKPQTLFTNCNVFDGKADKLPEGQNVLVEGNLIAKIGRGTWRIAVPRFQR